MQQRTEVISVESIIKVEPEQFENTVFVQKTTKKNRNLVKCENISETDLAYIKVEESDYLNDVPIVKLEPQR